MAVSKPLQVKRGTHIAFHNVNPILLSGQPGYEYDTHKLKLGDGKTPWNSLPYIGDHVAPKDGKSAYDIWIDQGNEGSVDDFLQSLVGPAGKSAYEIWLSFGYEGTLSDFLVSLIGPKGEDGKSAYDIWIEEGHTGTVQDFLDSLVGKSAYDIWIELGHTGTEADFIDSLKGDSAFEVWKKEVGGPEATVDDYLAWNTTTTWGNIAEED